MLDVAVSGEAAEAEVVEVSDALGALELAGSLESATAAADEPAFAFAAADGVEVADAFLVRC